MSDFKKVLFGLMAVMVLSLICWRFTGGNAAPVTPELTVQFVGLTNDPVNSMSPVRVCVAQGTTGLCVLFRVMNPAANVSAQFDTTGIEVNQGHGWELVPVPGRWYGVAGGAWTPGYGCLCAVGWPPGVSTNVTWRLRLSVAHEPARGSWRQKINRLLHHEFFGLYDQQTITSSEVRQ